MSATAENLMMCAKSFALSCQTLLIEDDPVHDLSIMLLGLTSLELSFKAWIKHHGATEADLRMISHDLTKAYDEAARLGLGDRTGAVRRAVELLSPLNNGFIRYMPETPGFHGLTTVSLCELVRAVAETVESVVWPDEEV
ncbi:hypothetical protein [Brevundimonas sp. SL161]|uniref:hypothetical protein n=1 Tax=Brevundimonas sp. SL161 TaxID=2804613 RepID=UPI003CF12EA3